MRQLSPLLVVTGAMALIGTTIHAQPAPAPSRAVSQTKLPGWDGSVTAEARALPKADRLALFRAIGAQPVGGGNWTQCTEDASGNSMAEIAYFGDISGDGLPEAVVNDSGTFCNGMAGVNSTVLTRTKTGAWKILYENQGFVSFLVSRGADGFPDIEAGLPGFCFPYFRWNGQEYRLIARLSPEGKTCTPL